MPPQNDCGFLVLCFMHPGCSHVASVINVHKHVHRHSAAMGWYRSAWTRSQSKGVCICKENELVTVASQHHFSEREHSARSGSFKFESRIGPEFHSSNLSSHVLQFVFVLIPER